MEPPQTPIVEHVIFNCTVDRDDQTQWFELTNIGARWFCSGHSFKAGDHIKIIMEKVPADVRSDRNHPH